MAKRPSPIQRLGRRWGAPPLPRYDGNETFAGANLVREIRDDDMAGPLFTALRRVLGAAESRAAGESHTDHLHAPDRPLPTIPGLDILLTPGFLQLTPAAIAETCLLVAEWAQESAYPLTRRSFTRAAAMSVPDDPETAHAAAMATLAVSDHPFTELWLRRVITGARRRGDWALYARAYLQLSDVLLVLQPEASNAALTKSVRAAGRHGLIDLRAEAYLSRARRALSAADHASAHDWLRKATRAFRRAKVDLTTRFDLVRVEALLLPFVRPTYEATRDRIFQAIPLAPSELRQEILTALRDGAEAADDEATAARCSRLLARL